MKTIDFIKASSSILYIMHKNGISQKDIEYIDLLDKAEEMAARGEQKVYIAQKLADEYGICVRNVYSIINRLNSEISL